VIVSPSDLDHRVRTAAFAFLEQQTQLRGEVFPREILARGFEFEGQRVPLLGRQGIFKPALLPDMPLSITTVPEVEGKRRPYDDQIGDEGLVRYRYRGTDPRHRDNVGLRLAMQRQVPLVYLYGVVPGRYCRAGRSTWWGTIRGACPSRSPWMTAGSQRPMTSLSRTRGTRSGGRT